MEALMVFVAIYASCSAGWNIWQASRLFWDMHERAKVMSFIEMEREDLKAQAQALVDAHNKFVLTQQTLDNKLLDLEQRVSFLGNPKNRAN